LTFAKQLSKKSAPQRHSKATGILRGAKRWQANKQHSAVRPAEFVNGAAVLDRPEFDESTAQDDERFSKKSFAWLRLRTKGASPSADGRPIEGSNRKVVEG